MASTMICHYEILGVERDASADELKKSYRKLALQWHPDKNPDRVEEVTKHFLLIQQAYDVLNDPQERAWYDKHREAILRGAHGRGDQYTDDSLDTFHFFNTSCFSGYKDSEQGFYAVYRQVFEQLAEEDYVFTEDRDDFRMPGFGDSTSSYEEIVGPFYAFWESFYTAKSYVWVEKYDTREAPERRVRRLMEAENKKLRDAARKERSEEVRALVGFVRKRDKRVQAYRKKLEERAAEVIRKSAERRDKHLKERSKQLENYEEVGWSAMSGLEGEMQKLEANLQEQFGDKTGSSGSDLEVDDDSDILDDLFCVACNKSFKSDRAFANHERSKKHKENVIFLKSEMAEEEGEITDVLVEAGGDDLISLETETPTENKQKLSKKQKKRRKQRAQQVEDEDISDSTEDVNKVTIEENSKEDSTSPSPVVSSPIEKSEANAIKESSSPCMNGSVVEVGGATPVDSSINVHEEKVESGENTASCENLPPDGSEKCISQSKPVIQGKAPNPQQEISDLPKVPLVCNVCQKQFPTRNKLFQHVKTEGHALHVPEGNKMAVDSKSNSKKKGRRKGKN